MTGLKSFCPASHRNVGRVIEARKLQNKIMAYNPFVMAIVNLDAMQIYPDLYPEEIGDDKLLSDKYFTKLETYALNELLRRPVPNVINLNSIQEEARMGKFERLDRILGFIDEKGNELEMIPIEQQSKMNGIMIDILKAKGLDFFSFLNEMVIAHAAAMDRQIELNRKEKKQKIRKMKLKSQRKLSAVNKTAPTKSTAKEPNIDKGSSAPSKIKTAKDHEHYRKSKRPTRI